MKKLIIIIIILLSASQAQPETITIFDSNSTISTGDSYDTVVVKGNGTVVNMTGGDVNNLIVMNASIFNMSGGSIDDGVPGNQTHGKLLSYDSSILNLSGGNIKRLECYNQSDLHISGNVFINEVCRFHNSSIATISYHNISIDFLEFYDNSTLNLLDGSVNECLDSYGKSTLNISGGNINEVRPSGEGVVNIFGGAINDLSFWNMSPDVVSNIVINISGGFLNTIRAEDCAYTDNLLNIIGYGLSAVPFGGNYGTGQITGIWNNDVSFTIQLDGECVYNWVVMYDGVVPTDCNNKPQSDINGDCKVDFADFSKMASEWLFDGTK